MVSFGKRDEATCMMNQFREYELLTDAKIGDLMYMRKTIIVDNDDDDADIEIPNEVFAEDSQLAIDAGDDKVVVGISMENGTVGDTVKVKVMISGYFITNHINTNPNIISFE